MKEDVYEFHGNGWSWYPNALDYIVNDEETVLPSKHGLSEFLLRE